MNVLVIGSGGREHALCWKIKQSPRVKKLYCAPGNAGIAQIAQCVDINASQVDEILAFALEKRIDLTVVGPEVALVAGVVDAFTQKGLMIFGPHAHAARLEGSKVFCKDFLRRRNIPTAAYEVYRDADSAWQAVSQRKFPVVIKADGLAAGKGVYICANANEAKTAIDDIMRKKIFAEAGDAIVVEECLEGVEASVLAISDGKHFFVLPTAQDHKRIFDEDKGPNTGGMGTVSPNPVVDKAMMQQIIEQIIEPAIRGMYQEGHPFKGVLYAGIMITAKGPQTLEFNVRFGDPETQVILPRLSTDLVDILQASCQGNLQDLAIKWDPRPCVCVVMASGGYPGAVKNGYAITGLDKITDKEVMVFHAGTRNEGGEIVTHGGRVLGVTALGANMKAAIDRAYEAVDQITFEHMFYRRDIAQKAWQTLQQMSETKRSYA